jgi:hypothetical protein
MGRINYGVPRDNVVICEGQCFSDAIKDIEIERLNGPYESPIENFRFRATIEFMYGSMKEKKRLPCSKIADAIRDGLSGPNGDTQPVIYKDKNLDGQTTYKCYCHLSQYLTKRDELRFGKKL